MQAASVAHGAARKRVADADAALNGKSLKKAHTPLKDERSRAASALRVAGEGTQRAKTELDAAVAALRTVRTALSAVLLRALRATHLHILSSFCDAFPMLPLRRMHGRRR
jgi:hypothetical protein